MGVGELILRLFIIYYIFYFVSFFNVKNRKAIKKTNKKLDKLRAIPIKTVEEQKAFIDLRYPVKKGKKKKFKWSWKFIRKLVFDAAVFIGLFMLIRYLFTFIPWEIKLWHSIAVVMILPIVINLILKKFNLQKSSDITVFFK